MYVYMSIFIFIHVSILPNSCPPTESLCSDFSSQLISPKEASSSSILANSQIAKVFNIIQWQYWGLQTLTIVTMTGQAYVTCPMWVSGAKSEAVVILQGKSGWLIKDAGWARPSHVLRRLDPPSQWGPVKCLLFMLSASHCQLPAVLPLLMHSSERILYIVHAPETRHYYYIFIWMLNAIVSGDISIWTS